MKLYELAEQMQGLEALLDSGEATAEMLADTIEGIEGQLEAKAESIVHVIINRNANIGAVDAEIARLTARKKSYAASVTHLKQYLCVNMEKSNITKITCPLFNISLRKGSPMVVIDDELTIPEDYKSLVQTLKIDKRTLLADLKKAPVEGAHLEPAKSGVSIK